MEVVSFQHSKEKLRLETVKWQWILKDQNSDDHVSAQVILHARSQFTCFAKQQAFSAHFITNHLLVGRNLFRDDCWLSFAGPPCLVPSG